MTRFELLVKEINKGIQVDERSNQNISGWSPNNVRRIIVGFDFAVVQYFVSGGKYGKLIEIVDFRKVLDEEVSNFQSNPSGYRGILHVLTRGRVCSSIEEIIFSTVTYPQPILQADANVTSIARDTNSLDSRFSRLRHVSLVNAPVKQLAYLAGESKKSDTLLLSILKEQEISCNTLVDLHDNTWWKGSSLRPKYYSMDSGVLSEYFARVKERLDQVAHEDKVESINENRSVDVAKKLMPSIISMSKLLATGVDNANAVFEKVPVLSKAEWASVLMRNNIYRTMRKVLSTNRDMVNKVRAIDFEGLIALERKLEVASDDVSVLTTLRDVVFNLILTDDEYKRESNKLPLYKSVTELQNLVSLLFTTYVNVVYLSLVKYLTRNTLKYVKDHHSQLQGVSSLSYTRSIVEFCNSYGKPELEVGMAKQAFDAISAVEILTENFTPKDKFSETSNILLSYLGG